MRISDWSSDVCSSDLAFWHAISDGLRGLPELRDDVRGIRFYVAPNGGGSLSDAIARTESAVRALTEKTELMMQTAWADRDADDEVAQFHCCGERKSTRLNSSH